ncbi:MAG: 2-oxoacid:ferredoxin oxidoreductase subunit beta [Anaerolineaceae bacterium]|jgi:2-oxoglutarate ferredoxin oxidoreductase subunit beta|nr:2-oxoacid:ferredoxin oxidoreductase subunit beta [Anaerolineae bacterium]MDX9829016.1 2-oxoacid:ferredoxin oxidoreductase subunit beta [Anaerolineae bacterium]NLF14490.1 2-oxoacid:ferredoxin oxidoreductase subunit beta [Anaerolineaceae bacterium]
MKRHDHGAYEYLRHNKKFPHLWCAGCGIGIVMGSLLRAVQKLELEQDDVALVSGIGCTGRMPVYMDFNTMHTTHGRALAFATGLKLARPEMEVIVIMGDGDALAIGGNHFIHAARRNIDLTAIVVNNNIYGMTGGQSSPTTPLDARSATAPYGHIEPPFPICDLAMAAGASFVARGTVYHVTELDRLIERAIEKTGFSLVEAVSYCHTTFGRANNMKSPVAMMRQLKENSITLQAAQKQDGDDGDPARIVRGIFRDEDRPEFTELYDQVIELANGPLPTRKRKVRRGWN